MTPSENQTLISILLEDPHLLIDLGCGVKQAFLISEGMYFTAFSFCIWYFMFVFKDKIVSFTAHCGTELTKENLCFIFVITPALGNLLFRALSKWILSQPFIFSCGDELMKVDSTICADQVATASLQLRIV